MSDVPKQPAGSAHPRHRSTRFTARLRTRLAAALPSLPTLPTLSRPVLAAVAVTGVVIAGAVTVTSVDSAVGAADATGAAGPSSPAAAPPLTLDRTAGEVPYDRAADGFGVSRGGARPTLDDAALSPDRRGAEAGVSGAASVEPPSDPRDIAMSMLGTHGWSSSEFSCLDSLWVSESNWDPSAENPTSGAYGIPQALPGSKMAAAGSDWETNPATQIEWGLDYIADTYGSPCAANSFKLSNGWY